MPHTPLADGLRRLTSIAGEAAFRGVEIDRVFEDTGARQLSRRAFLRRAGVASAGLAMAPKIFGGKSSGANPRVAIIGAGLAGLTCAYRLRQAGIRAEIHEANVRLGGRCWSSRGDFAEGQIAEHGGELIDQYHSSIRQLAQELRLPLDNLLAAEVNGTEPLYYFDGMPYTYREATNDLKDIWQKLHADLSAASYPTLYDSFTPRGEQLDRMSIRDWILETVPGGMESRLGQLLDVAYNIEYGAETERQSALNLIYLLGYNSPGQFSIFGSSNEKYHVRGGNDQIVSSLARELASQIVLNSALVAVRRNASGSYTLTLQSGPWMREITVDKVIFALPFSILNADVDLRGAGFSELKDVAIRELAMGSNSKLNMQFNRRLWIDLGNSGETYSDLGYQLTWEVTRAQPGIAGILVNYTGGDYASTFGRGTPAQRTKQFLDQIDPVLPGLKQDWNGRAIVDHWAGSPFTRGSYSFWQVGQYTRFAGIEGAQDGNAHFCGEHTSIDSQGYLNGAVESGERVAAEILADVS